MTSSSRKPRTGAQATRKFPRWLKWVAGILGLLLFGLLSLYLSFNEPKPEGVSGPEADALALKMLAAIDKPAWDSTAIVQWTFKDIHHFLWDKNRHLTQVRWGEKEVLLDINKVEGRAWEKGKEVSGETAQKMVQKAWEYWCNDAFWLNAPAKCMDPGTDRSIVTLDDGSKALLISYASGGVTPGDSYLWMLDETGTPTSYKMWVQIIPVGGMEFTWEDWTQLSTGARIAQMHKGPKLDLDISNLKGAANMLDFGLKADPFLPILRK